MDCEHVALPLMDRGSGWVLPHHSFCWKVVTLHITAS